MIAWKRENVFLLLCLFGDDKPHEWMEVINLGTRLFLSIKIEAHQYKTHQAKFEAFFKKAVNYGLIDKLETKYLQTIRQQRQYQIQEQDYNYKLSKKGDKLLRQEQAEREDNPWYYGLYDRTISGEFGMDTMAPLTPVDLDIKNKQTYKIKNLRK